MPSNTEAALRDQLVVAGRILAREGHEHLVFGHVSARSGNEILVKPAHLGLGELTPSDVVVTDMLGERIRGTGPLHGEMVIHTAILGTRPDVHAVVHTHPPGALRLSILASHGWDDAVAFTQDELPFLHAVGRYDDPDLVMSVQQGARLAAALSAGRAVLLANHGIVTVGASVIEAVVRAVLFERGARTRLALVARSSESPVPTQIVTSVAESMAAHQERQQPNRDNRLWEYLARRAG